MSGSPDILHLTDDQNFQCHSCGRCCRNSWTIRVEPEARAAIESSRISARLSREGYQPLQVIEDSTVATGRRDDGACLFLVEDELCGIHSELGGSQKPLACQLYPYSITATPDGYFASLSFACPSVVAGGTGDVEINRQELAGLLEARGGSDPDDVATRVEIVSGEFIAWSSYRLLEERLLEGFRPEDPVGTTLAMAAHILQSLAGRPEAVEGDDPWPELRVVLAEDSLEEAMLRMFCGSLIALLERPSEPESRQAFGEAVLAGESLYSARYGVPLPPFKLDLPNDPLLLETFTRYFQNAVRGKTLLASPVVSRLLCLACGFALILHYAEAFRLAEGGALSVAALARSFEVVEGEVVTHTRSLDPLFLAFETTLRQTSL